MNINYTANFMRVLQNVDAVTHHSFFIAELKFMLKSFPASALWLA